MKKDTFIRDTIVLTLTNSTTGILKFIFSIILSKKIGAEGMGLYGLIMPIYDLFCCIVCSGLIASVSKEISIFFSKNENSSLKISVQTSLKFIFIWSLLVCLLLFSSSPFITNNFIKDSRALLSLKVISPALIFVALSAILKGYFYGISRVNIPAIIDIVEKSMRITVVIAIISIFALKDITTTVTAIYISITAGEFVSFIILYLFYRNSSRKYLVDYKKSESRSQLLFNILIISIPLCVNDCLSTSLSTISTLIVPHRLLVAGINHTNALSMIGKFMGMAVNISFFPTIVITSMCIVLIPDLSQILEKHDYYSLETRINKVVKISFLLGISTLAVCFSLSTNLGELFYNRNDLGTYIKCAALCAPFAYTSTTTFSILNGIGKQGTLLKNSLIISVEELILLYFLTSIPCINILGYGISLVITSITSLILNVKEIKKKCSMNLSYCQLFIYFLVGVFLYLILSILNTIIPPFNFKLKTIILVIIGYSLFSLSVMLLPDDTL